MSVGACNSKGIKMLRERFDVRDGALYTTDFKQANSRDFSVKERLCALFLVCKPFIYFRVKNIKLGKRHMLLT